MVGNAPVKQENGQARSWPRGLTRVPFWVYQDPDIYRLEQQLIYQGPVWNFMCLESEIASNGDYLTTFIGDMPVIVTRDLDGEINALENRCAHRGALVCLKHSGNERKLSCVYHAWAYDLKGNLKGVAFARGVDGKGGLSESFRFEDHGLRKFRAAVIFGVVFATASKEAPPLRAWLGPEIVRRLERVLHKPVVPIGCFTQVLPNNWKLYLENTKDSYHASLLHLFATTFNIARVNVPGGLIVSEDGGSHVSYGRLSKDATSAEDYKNQNIRSQSRFQLEDPRILEGFDEIGDGISPQILSVFPGFLLGQTQNALLVRQILPKDVSTTHLNWTYLGYTDDTPELRRIRLRQLNLNGPAGFVSLEDGAVGGFVQRGIARAGDEESVLEMGGEGAESSDSRASEASVRGIWKAYRRYMDL